MMVYGTCAGCGATPCDHQTMLCDACTDEDMRENPSAYVDPEDPGNYCEVCNGLFTPRGECECCR